MRLVGAPHSPDRPRTWPRPVSTAPIAGSIKTRLQATVARVLPDPAKVQMHRLMSEPGSGSDPEPEHK